TGPREKRIDLWIGFAGWISVNAVLLLAAAQLGSSLGVVLAVSVILANIAIVTVLVVTRGYVAFGIGLALATAIALAMFEVVFAVIGLFVTAFTGGLETNY